MTVNQLWTKYQKKRTNKYRNDLVLHYLYLTNYYVNKISRKNTHVQEDELSGAAHLGLIEAVESYNPERKIKFETFCQRRISGAILDWLREIDLQSRTTRTFEKRKQEAEEALSHDGYYGETDVADKMGISYKRYGMLSKLLFQGREVRTSMLRRYCFEEDDNSDNWDTADFRELDPAYTTQVRLLKEFITKNLGRTERKVLILYYFEGLLIKEVAQAVNLCESRVSQIRRDAIAHIRRSKKHLDEQFFLIQF